MSTTSATRTIRSRILGFLTDPFGRPRPEANRMGWWR
jgi:hypothetical protein